MQLWQKIPHWELEKIFPEIDIPEVSDYEWKILIVLIFSIGCSGCLGRAIPFANKLSLDYKDKIQIIGIHTQFEWSKKHDEEIMNAKEIFHIRFPYFRDAFEYGTYSKYRAGWTPHWIICDREWKVQYSLFWSDPDRWLLKLEYKVQELLDS